jgi:hypothetical protein
MFRYPAPGSEPVQGQFEEPDKLQHDYKQAYRDSRHNIRYEGPYSQAELQFYSHVQHLYSRKHSEKQSRKKCSGSATFTNRTEKYNSSWKPPNNYTFRKWAKTQRFLTVIILYFSHSG